MKGAQMRAIYFDLDGTLLRFTREYGDLLADAIHSVNGTVTEAALHTYNDRFFAILEDCGEEPYRRAFSAIDGDTDRLVAALRDHEIAACEPAENAAADLGRLAEEYRLGVLTNGVGDWQRDKLTATGLAEYFDAVVTSYDVGAHKPDPAVFRAAERALPAEGYAMVGDDETADIHGARRVGWTALPYDGGGFADLPAALGWD